MGGRESSPGGPDFGVAGFRGPEGRVPRGAGRVAAGQLPELLLELFRRRHSGWVILRGRLNLHAQADGAGRQTAEVLFSAGLPRRVQLAEPGTLQPLVLAEFLPSDQLELVVVHAEQMSIDAFRAAEQLALLSPQQLGRAQEVLLHKTLTSLVFSGESVEVEEANNAHPREYLSDEADAAQFAHFVGLVSQLIALQSNREFFRERLKSAWLHPLSFRGPVGFHQHLEGVAHRVVRLLTKVPQSPATLIERGDGAEAELVGLLYTLRAMGYLRSRFSEGSEVLRPRITPLPPAGVGGTPLTPVPAWTARSSSVPPRPGPHKSSFPPQSFPPEGSGTRRVDLSKGSPERPSTRAPVTDPTREQLVEASCLDVWMRSVEEPELGQKALSLLEKAASEFPKNPRILFYLGCLCAREGREGRARAWLSRVLELDPDHDEAARELAQLRQRQSEYTQKITQTPLPGKKWRES